MAKVESTVFSSIRGSIGGTTFYPGKTSPIVARQRVSPVHPNTTYQQLTKSSFAQAVAKWTALTDDQRGSWNIWAGTITRLNKAGTQYSPSGRQEFISLYSILRYLVAAGVIPTLNNFETDYNPPDVPGIPEFPLVQTRIGGPSVAGTGIGFQFTNLSDVSMYVIVQVGNQVSFATNYFKGPYNPVDGDYVVQLPVGASPVAVDVLGLVDTLKYPYRIRVVQDFTSSATNYASCVVGEFKSFGFAEENVV